MLWSKLRSFAYGLLRRSHLEKDMGDELRFHIEAHANNLMVHRGLSSEEAMRQARIEFGSSEKYKEESREARGLRLFNNLWRDLLYAIQMLRKNPVFTITAIATLAFGIGATTAMFSLFHQILLRSLPVPEPDRLVNLGAPGPKPGSTSCSVIGDCEAVFSYPMFRDLEREQTVFTGIAAHVKFPVNLAYGGMPALSGEVLLVSGNYFPVLGLQPALGRLLRPEDDDAQSYAVVLSHAYWRTRFNESSSVLNQTLIVNGEAMIIAGVAPKGFDGTTVGSKPLVFVPIPESPL